MLLRGAWRGLARVPRWGLDAPRGVPPRGVAALEVAVDTIKVTTLLALKMVLFPVGLGALILAATRGLLGAWLSPARCWAFAAAHPLCALLLLWVAGITHMLVVTVAVLQLREVVHPALLYRPVRKTKQKSFAGTHLV